MRCVRPDFTTSANSTALRLEGAREVLERRDQVADDARGRGDVHRRREHVVGRLRRVDVVVGVHGPAECARWRASRAPRWCSCSTTCPSRSGRRRSGSGRRAPRRRPRPRRRRWRRRCRPSSTPSSAFAGAAAFLMRASASMWRARGGCRRSGSSRRHAGSARGRAPGRARAPRPSCRARCGSRCRRRDAVSAVMVLSCRAARRRATRHVTRGPAVRASPSAWGRPVGCSPMSPITSTSALRPSARSYSTPTIAHRPPRPPWPGPPSSCAASGRCAGRARGGGSRRRARPGRPGPRSEADDARDDAVDDGAHEPARQLTRRRARGSRQRPRRTSRARARRPAGAPRTSTPYSIEPTTVVSSDVSGGADDEHVTEALVEDDLRGDAGVGAAEDHGERRLLRGDLGAPVGALRRVRHRPATKRALPSCRTVQASAGVRRAAWAHPGRSRESARVTRRPAAWSGGGGSRVLGRPAPAVGRVGARPGDGDRRDADAALEHRGRATSAPTPPRAIRCGRAEQARPTTGRRSRPAMNESPAPDRVRHLDPRGGRPRPRRRRRSPRARPRRRA